MNSFTQVSERIAALSQALQERSPHIKTILHQIHTTLAQQPENVTLLTEEQIVPIIQGLEQVTNTHFAISSSKGAGSTKIAKKLANASMDAFGF